MAKITIEINTEDKSIAASINGKAVSNVSSISVYKMRYKEHYDDEEEEDHIGVSIAETEKVDDVEKSTYYYCKGSELAPKLDVKEDLYKSIANTLFPGRI